MSWREIDSIGEWVLHTNCSYDTLCTYYSQQDWVDEYSCCAENECNDPSDGGLPGWAIALIVIFVLIVVIILIIVIVVLLTQDKEDRV